jgi:citronellol/citronellal dehydrogenase
MTHALARRFFIPQKSGIINTIIAGVSRGFPGMVHTGAARAGIENFTKSLAVEWAPHYIRINAVAPGYIHSSGMEQYPPELKANINAAIPMRRLGTTTEVAWLTVFLSSPMAAYITGQSIYIDGAQGLWGSLWQVPPFEPAPAPAPFE